MTVSTREHRRLQVSLGVNLLFITGVVFFIAKKGGLPYVGEKLGIIKPVDHRADWQVNWANAFGMLPNGEEEIIFLGDSHTAAMRWHEYYSDIRNRGIGGDTSSSVLLRLREITESKPKQVFLNIGTNDLSEGVSVEKVADNVSEIVRRIHSDSPQTEVYVCSVLPINLDLVDNVVMRNKHKNVPVLNNALKQLQVDQGFTFVDLYSLFTDQRDYLKRE